MIRKANLNDVRRIQELINHYADKGLMLARSLNELYENVRDFWVYEENSFIYGCAALHIGWEDLAEVKSLAVEESRQKRGIGKQLLSICLEEARELRATKVFALTFQPEFFKRSGFRQINKSELPHKIWSECINCPKFPDCQETALILEL